MGSSVADWKEICLDMESFENDFYAKFNSDVGSFSTEKLNNAPVTRGKDLIFGEWLVKFSYIYNAMKSFTSSAGVHIEELNQSVTKGQRKVIELQEQLICRKDEQLAVLQSTVKAEVAGVQTAVKTEIGSWSKIVQQSTANTANVKISAARIKEAVKSAAAEDDRSSNVIIFGKQEEDNETVPDTQFLKI